MESSTSGILGHRNHTWFAGQFPHVFRSFSQPKRKLDLVQGFPIYPKISHPIHPTGLLFPTYE